MNFEQLRDAKVRWYEFQKAMAEAAFAPPRIEPNKAEVVAWGKAFEAAAIGTQNTVSDSLFSNGKAESDFDALFLKQMGIS